MHQLRAELRALKPGDHVCQVHRAPEEQREVAVAFLCDGLAARERCVSITNEPLRREITSALEQDGVDVGAELRRGALRFVDERETALRSGGPDAAVALLAGAADEALREGFTALRVIEEVTSALGPAPSAERVIEHEAKLARLLAEKRAIAVCQYDLSLLRPEIVRDALRTHPIVIAGGRVCANRYYEPPASMLGDSDESARVAFMLAQLEKSHDLERSLRVSEARFSALISLAPDAIVTSDAEHRITLFNEEAERLFGYSRDEVLGQPMEILLPEEQRARHAEMVKAFVLSEDVRSWMSGPREVYARRKDGSLVPVECTASKLVVEGVTILSAVMRDVSARLRQEQERRRLEAQLEHSQRLESIGRLAGGVAHDFNNLLSVILGYSELLTQGVDPHQTFHDDLAQIKAAADRAAALTRQLLAFSRKQVLRLEWLDLNEIVTGMEPMIRRLINEDIELAFAIGRDTPRAMVDRTQIETTIMNLVVNARDAMPNGGRLTIETGCVDVQEHYLERQRGLASGRYALLAVSDSGVGMDEVTMSRLFEPFFTTKDIGKGTGLGLSTVYGIVKQSGGHISVNSELGKGSTFKIHLPESPHPGPAEIRAAPASPARPRGTELVLLVEDDATVRGLAKTILRRGGYKVLEAKSATDALRLCTSNKGKIDLLVTDVVMPEMSGSELAKRMLEISPRMKVLFMSGHTDDSIIHHGVLDETACFLQKPLTPDGLLGKVREALEP